MRERTHRVTREPPAGIYFNAIHAICNTDMTLGARGGVSWVVDCLGAAVLFLLLLLLVHIFAQLAFNFQSVLTVGAVRIKLRLEEGPVGWAMLDQMLHELVRDAFLRLGAVRTVRRQGVRQVR